MNNSIYKKKIAFKQSLPQYGDGGKKVAAIAYGIGKNLPGGIGNMIGSTFANTDAIQENEKLAKSVDLGASAINTIAMGVANPLSLASNVPKTVGKGLDLGSTVAEEKGNTQRAERLDTAAMGMQGVGQIAGMATGMAGQFGGEGGFAQMFGGQGGFNPMQMMGDADIPIKARNGGKLNKLGVENSLWNNIRANAGSGKKPTPEMLEQERKIKAKYDDGGYTYSTEGANQGSNYNVVNPANTSNFVEPKKKVLSETEKVLMQQQVVQEDSTITDGLGNIIKRPEERATGAIEESVSPIDLIGSGIYSGGAKMLAKGLNKAGSKLSPKVSFKSEIDWAKWNKEIPQNKALMQEYNAIEQQAKASGTWMKNPDGSVFKGTPEQFVQQNSENFKKAFGNSKLINPDGSPTIQYHGSAKKFDTFDESKFQLGDSGYSGRGIYTTPDKNKASSYALSSKSIHKDGNHQPTIYELYGQGNNPISAEDLIKQKKDYDLFNFHRSKDWRGDVPLEEQMLNYDVAIRNQTRGVERISPWYQADELVFPTNKQLKSAIGNNGMFDMTNPNIYKSILPAATGLGAASQLDKKQNGGLLQYDNGGIYKGNPTAELELEENGIDGNGEAFQVDGPSHEMGGIAVNLPPETKINSDNKDLAFKYKGKKDTPAGHAKEYVAQISKLQKNRPNDTIAANTVKRLQQEVDNIFNTQEMIKQQKQLKANPLMMAKNGGKLPKYFNGGFKQANWWEQPLGSGTVDTFANSIAAGKQAEEPINLNIIKPTSLTSTQNLGPLYPQTNLKMQDIKPAINPAPSLGKNYKVGQAVDSNVNNGGLTMGDKFQLAGLAPATLYNTIQALRPAEKFNPLTSSLFGSGLNDMNQNVRFNTNPILMNRNVGANQINQGSTSDAVRRANLQSLYRGTSTQLGEMAEKEALTNAQIKQSLGQAKIGVGAQDVAAQERARQYNVQARQAKQQFGATAASQLGQGLTEFGKSSNQGLSNQMGYNTLQNLFSNYKLSGESYSDFLKRLDAGKVEFKKQ